MCQWQTASTTVRRAAWRERMVLSWDVSSLNGKIDYQNNSRRIGISAPASWLPAILSILIQGIIETPQVQTSWFTLINYAMFDLIERLAAARFDNSVLMIRLGVSCATSALFDDVVTLVKTANIKSSLTRIVFNVSSSLLSVIYSPREILCISV